MDNRAGLGDGRDRGTAGGNGPRFAANACEEE